MRAELVLPERVELSTARPDNLLLIQNQADGVVIRAARSNFSSLQKSFFIRYLAAEGYIPERYRWFANPDAEFNSGLKWVVDRSWVTPAPGSQRKAVRQVVRAIICAALFWLALMSFAFLHAPRQYSRSTDWQSALQHPGRGY